MRVTTREVRVGLDGEPQILEINANPGIAPDAGFAAAAAEVGLSYGELIEEIVGSASQEKCEAPEGRGAIFRPAARPKK